MVMKILKTFGRHLNEILNRIAKDAREAFPAVSKAIRKPALVCYILLTARRAQIFLAAAILALIFIFSPLVDSGLRTVFPEKNSKKFFGLVKKKRRNAAQEHAYNWILFSFWIITGGQTLLLVWLYIPKGVAKASSRARELESRGDQNLPDHVVEALNYYWRAVRLTCDTDHEAHLAEKIQALSQSDHTTRLSSSDSGDTFVETPAGNRSSASDIPDAAPSSPRISSIGPGNRYIIDGELGRGGMGIVYKARDEVLDRIVALKKLPRALLDDTEYLTRFKREAKTLARLAHPAILQIYDLLEDRDDVWMALEYVDGGDLSAHLSAHGPVIYSEAARLASAIAEGMAYAHARQTIHRDLKPANILLDKSMQPKISDFGLAKLSLSNSMTIEGSILGSPRYMSPEQAAGKDVDHRTDVYSLGIILYEMVSGRTPFEGDTSQILTKHITQPPPPLRTVAPDLPEDLEALIMHMLAKEVDERIETMDEVVTGLAAWVPTPQATHVTDM